VRAARRFAALGCGPGLEFYDPRVLASARKEQRHACVLDLGVELPVRARRAGTRGDRRNLARELFAVRWRDVDLQEAVIRVRRSCTGGTVGTPKNRERRDVDLISDVVELLARLRGECGIAQGENLVFPNADRASFLTPTVILRRHLYPAMAHAGVERVRPTLEKRTFHSFRHTFVKRGLESGAQITWLSRHLGHSTLEGDDRHLRPLGARRAQAPSRQDGGRISRVMRMRTRPGLHRGARTLTAREERPLCRHFSSGPGRSNLRPWD
jgi:integrase